MRFPSAHPLTLAALPLGVAMMVAPLVYGQYVSSAAPLATSMQTPQMMPLPEHLVPHAGRLMLEHGLDVTFNAYSEPRLERARARLLATYRKRTGVLRWEAGSTLPTLTVHVTGPSAPVQAVGEDESYRLEVTPQGATLTAANPLGALHGMQTFLQAIQATDEGFAVPCMSVDDSPRFAWRGLMIDTARHFMPPEVIKQNLDGMEVVKLNTLHWHLSDDQGFRVESKLYPKLTGEGSDGLFYTQAEIKDILAYARDRGIRVMPEFEMPSHAGAMYVGYPELADGTGPYRLKRKFGEKWGRPRTVAEDSTMDPTKESTYAFLDRLIGEMGTLFPDAFFHVGGDAEDSITEWGKNAHVLAYMQAHGMKDTEALHAYFTNRLAALVKKHGKTMVGWDEVLTPTTPKDVVIHSWRGLDSMATAIEGGHRALLSWGYYLDLSEPASRHFTVDPWDGKVAGLTAAQKSQIFGGETAMWSEYVSPETVDGRIWPRAAVIAERLWSPREDKDVPSMYLRLKSIALELTAAGVPYVSNREWMFQRLVGDADAAPLKVLGSVVEPPKGFPREGDRQYDVYSSLSHLADIIPAESDAGREFRELAHRIATGNASEADWTQAKTWLAVWLGNEDRLKAITPRTPILVELDPVSHQLASASAIGLQALDALRSNRVLTATDRDDKLAQLQEAGKLRAEMTIAVVPGIEELVKAASVSR